MTEFLITSFVTLFVVIDPIGLLPLFVALTQGMDKDHRRSIAIRAVVIGFFILSTFAFAGESLLELIGIGMPAFRISGGLLVFLISVEMLFEKRKERREKQTEEEPHADPSVFPLATPLVAGPGAMATVILLAGQMEESINSILLTLLSVGGVLIITYVLFLFADPLERLMGKTGINVVTRLLGMLLAALAVQFVVDGMRDLGALG